jgi:predicted HTH transcriptional regulator
MTGPVSVTSLTLPGINSKTATLNLEEEDSEEEEAQVEELEETQDDDECWFIPYDDIVPEELNKLSLNEREKILHDIHGISDLVEESPELIARLLSKMDTWIVKQQQKPKKTEAYDLAELQSPGYVKDKDFRLIFLRADDFNSKQAAHRMIRFFDKKLEMFGPSKLCKDITLKDLSPEERACVENGHLQLLPVRDRSGRAVVTTLLDFIKFPVSGDNDFLVCRYSLISDEEL